MSEPTPNDRPRFDLDAALTKQLVSGERLLWSARPQAEVHAEVAMGTYRLGVGLNLLFGGMALLAMLASKWSSALCIAPFVVGGIYMLYAPDRARAAAKRMLYAVTDRRCVVLDANDRLAVRAIQISDVQNLLRSELSDHSGNLTLHYQEGEHQSPRAMQLIGVPDVRSVDRLIRMQRGEAVAKSGA